MLRVSNQSRGFKALTTGFVLVVVLGACAQDGDGEGGGEADDIKIGVSLRTSRQGRWAFEADTMRDVAKELGAEVVIQDANEDAALQSSQVESMISQEVDALILGAVDAEAAIPLVQKAHSADIPVVAYDTPLETAELDYFVTRNNVDVGVMQAEAALKWADGGGNWAIFKGDPSAGVATEIAEGYEQTLGDPISSEDINIVLDQFHAQWSSEEALKNAENVLSAQDNNLQVFLASSDGLAFGVTRALAAEDLGGEVFVSGLDAEPANLKLIADGLQTMTVWAPLEEWARLGFESAYALAKGDEPKADGSTPVTGGEIPTGFVSIQAVNKSNLCQFVTKIAPEGWASRSEVFADNPEGCQ